MLRHGAEADVLAWVAAAWAGSAEVVGPGDIVGSVVVGLAPADARGRLQDPVWVSHVDAGSTSVTVKAPDGPCLLVDYVSPAVITATYTVRQCPTETGATSTLVTSNIFSAYTATWSVAPEGSGSKLTYHITLTPRYALPAFVVDGSTKKGIESMMQAFATKFPP